MALKWFIKLAPVIPVIIGDVRDLAADLTDDEDAKKQARDAVDGIIDILTDLRKALD